MRSIETYEFTRSFLVSGLPDEIAPSDPHLQVFDNYVENSRLRLRKARNPSNDERRYFLEKIRSSASKPSKTGSIELSPGEYRLFGGFIGREIRFNRYEHSLDGTEAVYDIFLGDLWGLNTACVGFDSKVSSDSFAQPRSFIREISGVPFFDGANLVDKSFEDVRRFLSNEKEGRT